VTSTTDLPVSRRLRLVPDAGPSVPRGEVCVLIDPDRAVVWLHGEVDGALRDDLVDAGVDLVDAALPVTIHAAPLTACDDTALLLVSRLLSAGLPVRLVDPDGVLTRALQRAVHPANRRPTPRPVRPASAP
jgi:hypothetical protein